MDADDTEITLNPAPGFVIKTHLLSSKSIKDSGIKVFINVCTDSQVPQPENVFGEELFSRIQNGEDWVVPVVISKQREDYDRAGKRCLVWDCCIHPRVVLEATKDKGVKIILIETCIELVEDSASVELSREYVTPKLLQKGDLEKTLVNAKALQRDKGFVGTLDSAIGNAIAIMNHDDGLGSKIIEPAETKKLKKPLIQEISSVEVPENTAEEDVDVSFSISDYKGPYNGEGSAPRYSVEIRGMNELDISKAHLAVGPDDKMLTVFGKKLSLPQRTTKIEAYYARDTGLLYVFAY